ncbi:MAG: Guanylate kinase [Candidatus Moranbacteria bacterium GW2011_GWE2_35_2-]|nr:MAG: Guanylate kinase [Candidatus Moranbacteria bacterium GW2011_GWE2_35_2-]KKQ06360.1 MAG: Guanylate kinase [Candidatus Moranbacteria bacterium GW2011_GWF1_36_4]KKQ22199.1 MAG: Guanylate kinase [Candidatus Moranbacteria bacterium GW2011_GWF2_37_11]KKQ28745.1 MAG: Guanylate kinase [Candidatus Moranbacteria bacterium GW2011_GWD1_37_17]KKQ30309.1 MAG: Guanylate kinase [Candidatus Moranbacteria bacterium GW2011_GWE1_37_24]KKQ47365.1 MAG: Guanylate kinase [Candidatus Moranbacteria bacterium GW2
MHSNKTNIFLISGPSGAGEDSILNSIKNRIDFIKPITTTTREPREGEINGKTYYFTTADEFKDGIKNGKFLEWAQADREKFYGVTKKEIARVKKSGKIVLWKVDYKGVLTIKKLLPETISVLITAPLDILEKRIRTRDNASEEFIRARMEYAKGWLENEDAFDYKIKNEQGKLNEAVEKFVKIIKK